MDGASLPPDADEETSEASLLFESFLQGPVVDEQHLESLCARHPDHARGLRELWRFHRVRQELGFLDSIAELFGSPDGESNVSPTVSLPEIDARTGDPTWSSDVLDALGGREGTFERYVVREELGRGAMGVVRRAWDADLRRHLAVKTLSPRFASAIDPARVDSRKLCRFVEEAQVTAQLDHPGIVPIHEIGFDPEGRVYFTMKLVEGSTLEDVLEAVHRGDPNWSVNRVLGILMRVCEALAYAHTKGVLHRDVKPANIMVGRFGEVFLMDWGLARVFDRVTGRLVEPLPGAEDTRPISTERHDGAEDTPGSALYTQEGGVVGTPAFMSPEQARGDLENLGPPSDVYALGSILYVLLTGRLPYAKGEESLPAMAVLAELRKGPPTPVEELAPDTPPELVAICERAMARRLDDRYANTAELNRDLAAYLEGHVVHAYRRGAWQELTKWVRRNTGTAASLLAAGFAVVAAVALLLGYVRGEERAQRREDLLEARRELEALHAEEPAGTDAWRARAGALAARAPALRDELDGSDAAGDPLYAEELARLLAELEALEARLAAR